METSVYLQAMDLANENLGESGAVIPISSLKEEQTHPTGGAA